MSKLQKWFRARWRAFQSSYDADEATAGSNPIGVAIFMEWPASGLWVLGMFVGIDLIANGVTWMILAAGVRDMVAPIAD